MVMVTFITPNTITLSNTHGQQTITHEARKHTKQLQQHSLLIIYRHIDNYIFKGH